jgi:hypothetical protein
MKGWRWFVCWVLDQRQWLEKLRLRVALAAVHMKAKEQTLAYTFDNTALDY